MHNPDKHSTRAASALALALPRFSVFSTLLLSAVTLLVVSLPASPLLADGPGGEEPIIVHKLDRGDGCPDIKVLGASGFSMLSLSPSGFLGVEVAGLTPELRQHFGVTDEAGVMLSRVVEGSAAAIAGLEVGDIVTTVEGESIDSPGRLGRVVRGQDGGATVEIEYWRDRNVFHTTATLEERERCALDIGDYLDDFDFDFDFDELPALEGLEISQEALRTALRSAREALHNHDWTEKLEGLKSLNLERMEESMKRVQ